MIWSPGQTKDHHPDLGFASSENDAMMRTVKSSFEISSRMVVRLVVMYHGFSPLKITH